MIKNYSISLIAALLITAKPMLHAAQNNTQQMNDPLKRYKTLQISRVLINERYGDYITSLDAIQTKDNFPCHVSIGVMRYSIYPSQKGHINSLEGLNIKPTWSWKRLRQEKKIKAEYAHLLILNALEHMDNHNCSRITTNLFLPKNALQRWKKLYEQCGFIAEEV